MELLRLLAEQASDEQAIDQVANAAYNKFIGIVNIIFPLFIGAILVLGLFFGVNLAIKYARAEEEEKKKKAKEQLINVIVACLIAVVFVAIIELVLNGGYVQSLFTKVGTSDQTVNKTTVG